MRRGLLAGLAALLLAGGVPVPAQEFRYEVRPGDSLWDIGSRYLRNLEDLPALSRLNGVTDPRRVLPGTSLRIPVALMREVMVAGTAFAVTGEVLRRTPHATAASPLRAGQRFGERDVLQAGMGGAATLLLPDGSKIRMVEGAELEILRMRRFADTLLFDSRLRLTRGRVETEVRPLGAGGRFEILTPAAVTSVRGTDYRVRAAEAAAVTEVVEGQVGFGNAAGTTEVPGGFGARVEAGRPPAAPRPLLAGPDLGALPAVLGVTPVTLVFPAVPGAASYRVQTAADPAFSRPMFDGVVAMPELTLPHVPDGDLHLRVRAIDPDGIEGLETRRSLRVAAPPERAELLGPPSRHLAGPGPIRFTWNRSSGGTRSRLEFALDRSFAAILDAHEAEGTELRVDPPFGEDRRLFWRVIAVGRETEAAPSEARSIRRAPPPAALPPELVVPPDAVPTWRPIPGVSTYRVQVIPADRPEATPVFEGELAQPALDRHTLRPGRYLIRVQGVDADGARGPWGEFASLAIQEAPPAPPATGSEITRLVTGPVGPTLVWSDADAPPEGYRVQVASDIAFRDVVLDRRVGRATRIELPASLPAGRYHWRVAAAGHTIDGPFGEPRVLEWVPGPVRSRDVTATLGLETPRLVWDPVVGAASYRVEVVAETRERLPARTTSEPFATLEDAGPGRYRWRVVAVAPDGTAGEVGPESDLVVRPPPLSGAVPLEPPDAARVASGRFVAHWTEISGATGYLVETADTAAFRDGVRGRVVDGASVELVVPPSSPVLYWRVIPVRGEERGPASPVRSVVVPPARIGVAGVLADHTGVDVHLSSAPVRGRGCVEMSRSEQFPPPVERRCAAGTHVHVDALAPGRWFLRGIATNADGVQSDPGDALAVDVPERPTPRRGWWWLPPLGILLLP